MNYTHPTITVLEPDPGHFVVRGHATSYKTAEGGTVCPLEVCDIPPGVPSELLQAILEARGFVDVEPAATLEEMGTFETIRELRAANADLRTEIAALEALKGSKLPVITEGQPHGGIAFTADQIKESSDNLRTAMENVVAQGERIKNKGGRPTKAQLEARKLAEASK